MGKGELCRKDEGAVRDATGDLAGAAKGSACHRLGAL